MWPFNRSTAGPAARPFWETGFGTLRPGERLVDFAHCHIADPAQSGRVTVFLTDQRVVVRRVSGWQEPTEPPLMNFDGADIAQVRQVGVGGSGRFALTVTGDSSATEISFLPKSDHAVSMELAQNLYENLEFCVMHWRQGQIPFEGHADVFRTRLWQR